MSLKSKIDKSKWSEMYLSGMTMREIAERIPCSPGLVLRQLRKDGTETRPDKPRSASIPVTERVCSFCRHKRPIEDFYNNKKLRSGKGYVCKFCFGGRARQDEKAVQQAFIDNPELYQELLTKQNGRCAICNLEQTGNIRLCVDHCHTTNKIRGLLCNTCNSGIGLLGDNIEGVSKALEYLKSVE